MVLCEKMKISQMRWKPWKTEGSCNRKKVSVIHDKRQKKEIERKDVKVLACINFELLEG